MAADVIPFDVWAGSAKGLMARPVLPNDVIALRSHIAVISATIYKLSGGAPVTVELDVSEVMSEALELWSADDVGRSFFWSAPGSLWPDANEQYRIVVTFTTTPEAIGLVAPAVGAVFLEVYQANTKNPSGP